MAYDFTQYFGHDYVPSYMSAVRPDQLAQALQYLTAGGPRGHGGNLATHIGDIYGSFQKNTGLHAPVKVWAQQYWDWLSKGAQTKHNYASTLQNVDTGNVSANVLHYVPGQGYVTEADLQSVDPAQYQAIQDERAAAVKDGGRKRLLRVQPRHHGAGRVLEEPDKPRMGAEYAGRRRDEILPAEDPASKSQPTAGRRRCSGGDRQSRQ